MNYGDYLFAVREGWLENTVLVDVESGKRYSYRSLQVAVRALAGRLREMGYQPGDVIATHLYNGAEVVIGHLAIQFIGCVSCLLDPLIPAQGLTYYINDTRAKCLMTHLPAEAVQKHLPENLTVLETASIATLSEGGEGSGSRTQPFDFDRDDLAAIFYTSGTTSRPKGVMLSPKNFYAHFHIFNRSCYTYAPDDRLLCFVPFSHGYGSKSIFIPCLHAGAGMVIMRSFQPIKVVEVVRSERITHLFGVPSHFQQLLRREELYGPMRRLKAAFTAAALLKLETAREWNEKVGVPLDEGYGLIETCTGVAFRKTAIPDRLGNVGTYPRDLVQVEIADDTLQPLPPNERGEVVIRGESVMMGYLNMPDETARALHDGWFRTGDMGYKTEQDEIILVGRIKDVINVAGIKVAPFEIEAVLNEHPEVGESAVVGVADETYGEVVQAFVKPTKEATRDERELVRYLQKRLINFQVPKKIFFVDEFPRNTMGKIDKKALRTTAERVVGTEHE